MKNPFAELTAGDLSKYQRKHEQTLREERAAELDKEIEALESKPSNDLAWARSVLRFKANLPKDENVIQLLKKRADLERIQKEADSVLKTHEANLSATISLIEKKTDFLRTAARDEAFIEAVISLRADIDALHPDAQSQKDTLSQKISVFEKETAGLSKIFDLDKKATVFSKKWEENKSKETALHIEDIFNLLSKCKEFVAFSRTFEKIKEQKEEADKLLLKIESDEKAAADYDEQIDQAHRYPRCEAWHTMIDRLAQTEISEDIRLLCKNLSMLAQMQVESKQRKRADEITAAVNKYGRKPIVDRDLAWACGVCEIATSEEISANEYLLKDSFYRLKEKADKIIQANRDLIASYDAAAKRYNTKTQELLTVQVDEDWHKNAKTFLKKVSYENENIKIRCDGELLKKLEKRIENYQKAIAWDKALPKDDGSLSFALAVMQLEPPSDQEIKNLISRENELANLKKRAKEIFLEKAQEIDNEIEELEKESTSVPWSAKVKKLREKHKFLPNEVKLLCRKDILFESFEKREEDLAEAVKWDKKITDLSKKTAASISVADAENIKAFLEDIGMIDKKVYALISHLPELTLLLARAESALTANQWDKKAETLRSGTTTDKWIEDVDKLIGEYNAFPSDIKNLCKSRLAEFETRKKEFFADKDAARAWDEKVRALPKDDGSLDFALQIKRSAEFLNEDAPKFATETNTFAVLQVRAEEIFKEKAEETDAELSALQSETLTDEWAERLDRIIKKYRELPKEVKAFCQNEAFLKKMEARKNKFFADRDAARAWDEKVRALPKDDGSLDFALQIKRSAEFLNEDAQKFATETNTFAVLQVRAEEIFKKKAEETDAELSALQSETLTDEWAERLDRIIKKYRELPKEVKAFCQNEAFLKKMEARKNKFFADKDAARAWDEKVRALPKDDGSLDFALAVLETPKTKDDILTFAKEKHNFEKLWERAKMILEAEGKKTDAEIALLNENKTFDQNWLDAFENLQQKYIALRDQAGAVLKNLSLYYELFALNQALTAALLWDQKVRELLNKKATCEPINFAITVLKIKKPSKKIAALVKEEDKFKELCEFAETLLAREAKRIDNEFAELKREETNEEWIKKLELLTEKYNELSKVVKELLQNKTLFNEFEIRKNKFFADKDAARAWDEKIRALLDDGTEAFANKVLKIKLPSEKTVSNLITEEKRFVALQARAKEILNDFSERLIAENDRNCLKLWKEFGSQDWPRKAKEFFNAFDKLPSQIQERCIAKNQRPESIKEEDALIYINTVICSEKPFALYHTKEVQDYEKYKTVCNSLSSLSKPLRDLIEASRCFQDLKQTVLFAQKRKRNRRLFACASALLTVAISLLLFFFVPAIRPWALVGGIGVLYSIAVAFSRSNFFLFANYLLTASTIPLCCITQTRYIGLVLALTALLSSVLIGSPNENDGISLHCAFLSTCMLGICLSLYFSGYAETIVLLLWLSAAFAGFLIAVHLGDYYYDDIIEWTMWILLFLLPTLSLIFMWLPFLIFEALAVLFSLLFTVILGIILVEQVDSAVYALWALPLVAATVLRLLFGGVI